MVSGLCRSQVAVAGIRPFEVGSLETLDRLWTELKRPHALVQSNLQFFMIRLYFVYSLDRVSS